MNGQLSRGWVLQGPSTLASGPLARGSSGPHPHPPPQTAAGPLSRRFVALSPSACFTLPPQTQDKDGSKAGGAAAAARHGDLTGAAALNVPMLGNACGRQRRAAAALGGGGGFRHISVSTPLRLQSQAAEPGAPQPAGAAGRAAVPRGVCRVHSGDPDAQQAAGASDRPGAAAGAAERG